MYDNLQAAETAGKELNRGVHRGKLKQHKKDTSAVLPRVRDTKCTHEQNNRKIPNYALRVKIRR
jgi:hypothetical protein